MKLIKLFFYLIFIMVLVAIAVPVALMIFVNPNQFKPQIEKEVQNAIHQPFSIKGNLGWTFFPVAGIKANGVSLGQNLMNAKTIELSVAVKPLFHKEIRVGKIEIDGMNLHLVKNAKGQANWDFNIKSAPTKPEASTVASTASASPKASNAVKIAAFSISRISIKDSQISLDDATTDKHIVITHFNFSSSQVGLNTAFPVALSMTVNANTLAAPIVVSWHSDLAFNADNKALKLTKIRSTLNNDLTLNGTASIVFANTPTWRADIKLTNINVEKLLKLFKKNSLDISGTGNVSANLTGTGSTQNLNGNLTFDVQNGIFHGIDLYYYSEVADSLANKAPLKSSNTHQTPFGVLTGTARIQNGVLSNNDLLIKASKINATGQGTANLNTQQLNYKISLQRMTSGADIKPRGPAIPIAVTGNFAKPSISVDMASLAASEVKQVIADKVKEYGPQLGQKIQQGLASILGN